MTNFVGWMEVEKYDKISGTTEGVVHFFKKSYVVILFLILINQLTIQNCMTEKYSVMYRM